MGINLESLFRKKPQFLKKDRVETEVEAGNANEEAAPSEATVIIEDEPPQKVSMNLIIIQISIFYSSNIRFSIFQDEKNLVYAELMLKPSADSTKSQPNKNSTEYAEIVYVSPDQKSADKK